MNNERVKRLRKYIRKQRIKQIISGALIVAVAVAGATLMLSVSTRKTLQVEKHDSAHQYIWEVPGKNASPEAVNTKSQKNEPLQPLSVDIQQYEGNPDSLNGILTVLKAEASTHAYSDTSASASFDAPNACDGNVATSWQVYTEDGIGQSATFGLEGEQRITGFCLWLGNWRDDRFIWDDVPTALSLEFWIGGKAAEVIEARFEAEQAAYLCSLNRPVTADTVKLTILEATGMYSEICLAEIAILGEAEAE